MIKPKIYYYSVDYDIVRGKEHERNNMVVSSDQSVLDQYAVQSLAMHIVKGLEVKGDKLVINAIQRHSMN
jgi:hypothetical protein